MPALSRDQWRALSAHLDIALDLAEQDRGDRLQKLLGSHQAVAARGFLDGSAAPWLTNSGMAGQTLSGCTLISQLGQGGTSSVWLAKRRDAGAERTVAVKFLNFALVGTAGEQRFKREGAILGRLTHPHIAALIDAGISPARQPYLVLEYIDGDPIDRHCDRRQLDVTARLRLFLEVLQAVSLAHNNRIVHRDLKPVNILIRKDGVAKLLDFGIARLMEENQRKVTTLTVEGGRAMTPEYAAPEQLTGELITPATDVYTLGVLLYILLTGSHPSGAGRLTPAMFFKTVLETEPCPPSRIAIAASTALHRGATPEDLSQSFRGDLDSIIAKALKKNPGERYASAADLADDLHGYLTDKPVHASSQSIAGRLRSIIRKFRTRAVTVCHI